MPCFWYRKKFLFIALLVMMVISVYQYSWSLFAYSIQGELGWDLATVGLTFTVFSYSATFIQPLSGLIVDLYSPRKIALLASFLVGMGFILCSFSSVPSTFSLLYGLGGLGVGILYGVSTGAAIKWFPDRRGAATGLVVFGFGAGTAFFNWIIEGLLESAGFRTTFLYVGLLMLLVTIPSSMFYRYPPDEWSPHPREAKRSTVKKSVSYKPLEVLNTYQWYLIYFSFSFTVSIVLMFGAQLKMLATEFGTPQEYFSLLLILFPLGNGLSRIVAGAVSDRFGREKTVIILYGLLGLSMLSLVALGSIPIMFLLLIFATSLFGGAPFALYPAIIGDYYGSKYATVNYGITYTAKAWAGLISGWLSGYLATQFGSYKIPLTMMALGSLLAAALSNPKWLKPPSRIDIRSPKKKVPSSHHSSGCESGVK